jgi:hypothetical protein
MARLPTLKANRPIEADCCWRRANHGPSKLVFEFKSANFRRIGEAVRRVLKKVALIDQRVTIVLDNRVVTGGKQCFGRCRCGKEAIVFAHDRPAFNVIITELPAR